MGIINCRRNENIEGNTFKLFKCVLKTKKEFARTLKIDTI